MKELNGTCITLLNMAKGRIIVWNLSWMLTFLTANNGSVFI